MIKDVNRIGELDDKMLLNYGMLPLFPYLIFNSLMATIGISLVMGGLIYFIVLEDDENILFTKEELAIKRSSFYTILIMEYIPLYLLSINYFFKG
jgi:hypothetical protein